MKEDKAYILRKALTVLSLVLIFATAGLLAITTQLKTITFNYYGNVKSIKTLASSVDAFLLQNNISLNESAVIEPQAGARITNGMTITVSTTRADAIDIEKIRESYAPVVASVKEEIQAIPFEEEKVDNADRESGETEVLQEGVEGSKSISYIVKTSNNQVIQKNEIKAEVIQEAQNRVVEVGTKVSRSSLVSSIYTTPVDGGFISYNIDFPEEYQHYAYNLCQRYGIDYSLFISIMFVESRFQPNASNGGLYIGLCQVAATHLPNLSSKLGISDLYDPYDNMTAGAYLLSYYINANGSIESGLASYGGGASYVNLALSTRERLIVNGGLSDI